MTEEGSKVNKIERILVDASSAGSGNLEIMINGGRVPCRVREIVSRQYKAVFTPTQNITHTIEMRFNGEEVVGSPWHIPVEDRPERRHESTRTLSYYSELSGAGLVRAPVNKIASFEINGEGLELNDVKAKIYGPDGREFPVRIVPRGSGRYTAEYRIEEVGEHHLTVWIAGRKVDGSPLSVAGYSADRVRLEPLGGGAVGHPVQFVVDAVDAGKGQLEISVNQGRVPNNVQMQGAGRCLVTFIPQHPGTYVIDVTFNGEQVHGCPIKVEILPKQVGEVVHANLTPTAVSTAISTGGSSIAGAFRQSRTPVSPALLHHSRQRSAETNPRSPTLLREARSRAEKPWMQTYAPTSSRLSSSLSPNREWSTGSAYDRVYTTERTLSPSDTLRARPFTEAPAVHRTPSPPRQKMTYETRTYYGRSSTPPETRSRGFDHHLRTPSPKRYERNTPSSFIGVTQPQERAYRSPSPISRDDIRSRASDRVVSPYGLTPSPISGERIRRVEQIDPVAAEEERGRRRVQAEKEKIACSSVGYTVAQYGQPGNVTVERCHSPDRYSLPRSYRETYDKKELRDTVSPSSYYSKQRAESPEYSAVYERFDRKRDEPPPTPAHAQSNHSVNKTAIPSENIRSRSPPPDYDTGPSTTQSLATSVKTYDEPTYSQTTTSTRITHSRSPKQSEKDNETKPEVAIHRTGSELDEKLKSKNKDDLSYLRTQSELIRRDDIEKSKLPQSEEKYKVSEMAPEKLKRTSELTPLPLTEEAQRTMEYLRIRAEDDEILRKHGFGKRSHESSIEIQEPASEIRDDVVEVAGSKDAIHDKPSIDTSPTQVEALEPVAELPHSPAPSAKSTPHTTPKTSMKFKKEGKEIKPFEFGKSKFTSKHEVVKRGKNVEVKLENLKLSKEDTLRVVVLPPMRNQLGASGDSQPELETKVKRSGSKYEVTFRPTEVGTHKVFAYVNEIQHPLSPFPIRVYDSSEIIVGEIPAHSNLNDTVEFTVDAGRAGFGNLEMAIKDADGIIIPSHVAQLESGTAKFLVTFTPTSRGLHTVNITFNKEVLKNSPFEVLITDPPEPLNDIVDGAGSPTLSKKDVKKEKEEKKKEEKERVKREKEEKGATFKKERRSKHRVVSKTSVTKIPSLSRVGQPSNIIVEVAGHDQLEIAITDNKKNQIGTELIEIEPGVMQVNFTPQVVGDHDIEVKYGGVPVTAIPFTCRAYDPTKIKVGTIPKGLLDKPVYFTVDASEAGVGNLEVAVNDGRVPSMAHALGQHRYDISFVPKENADHTITIRFNNEPVPGSPFTCQLVAAAQASASGPGIERVPVDEPTEIKIQTSASEAQPEVRVRDPMGLELPMEITPSEKDQTLYIAKYTPKCVGNHQVDISMHGEPIAGSPFTAKAYDARMARLSQCDQAVVGKPCTFAIDAARAGAGNMEIIVSVDNHNVPNFVQAEGQAKFKVSFTPQEAKEHVISVRFNGVSVPGSPMKCMVEKPSSAVAAPAVTSAVSTESSSVTATLPEQSSKYSLAKDLEYAQVGRKHGFTIPNPGGRAAECNVVVIDPSGGPLPVRCYRQQDDSYWVEFIPEHIGLHTIEVTFGDVPVTGSPFRCEVVDPRKVRVSGLNEDLLLRQATIINVDRREAGSGELVVEVSDPMGTPLKVETIKSPGGEDCVTFLPSQTGPHRVTINVAGFPIPGYPRTVMVSEQQQPTVYGAAVDHSIKIDEPASLIFDPKGNSGGLKVSVFGPRDNKVRHKVIKRANGTSEVAFSPEEVGAHIVHIEFNNKPIAGSPFTVRVVDPSKVVVNDLDMDRDGSFLLRLGQQNVFDVDATAAGPGKLRAEVRNSESTLLGDGPAVDDLGYGKYRVTFTPRQPGRYSIYLYWNELPVESAFPLRARSSEERPTTSHEKTTAVMHTRDKSSSSVDDLSRILVRGDGLHRSQLKEPNEFIVDGSDISREGRLTATLFGTKADVPVRVQQLGHNVYKGTYTPLTGGTYELHILWNGVHVKGSPFKVNADTASTPAELITVDSSSLKIGIINDDIKTVIDTRRAGPGQLSAQCMGPVKLAYCELYDHRDGTYTLSVKPTEVGKHTLTIKYDDQHVRGSPFIIHVSLPPDPSKVRVYGPGIEHGILSLFKSNFVVETRGAGAGQLTVRVRGPKGAFNVEMQREKKNERTIHCKYEPKEPGDYQVEVKWHGEHVPGSPFLVMIVDTEQELSRFLRGEAPSPTPATPFVPPGWVGPPPLFPPPMGQRYGPPMGPMGPMGPIVPPPPGAMMPMNGPPATKQKAKYH
ncbi:hypothetical protein KIN20_021447 [Parelaphostrongylus tenuis]|uniref:FiLamiN (Actin binding protein) homolog n=1 Tax=Parelaphostrongylus tenuis TaxID=148309 RepID=A0AAD5QW74_PARTN|nr:hypothetical protein KIN20_021447 [Parelaphostrongylus tenuis]